MDYQMRRKIQLDREKSARAARALDERNFMKALLANPGARLLYQPLWLGGPEFVRLFDQDGNLKAQIKLKE